MSRMFTTIHGIITESLPAKFSQPRQTSAAEGVWNTDFNIMPGFIKDAEKGGINHQNLADVI